VGAESTSGATGDVGTGGMKFVWGIDGGGRKGGEEMNGIGAGAGDGGDASVAGGLIGMLTF
jgi:hypothetical protein